METELNKKNDKYKTFRTCSIICLIALVLSFAGCGIGDSKSSSSTSHGQTIVKGSENIPKITIKEFFTNIGKNTGIYKLIHTETAEEKAALEAQEAAIKAAESIDPFAGKTVPGWKSFVMMAIGFLIVYLAVAKGFEPLLLIPIGFGTILVNIPGAGMGDAPHGMLHIIYSAGVGNEFFPMLIFMGIGAMTDFGPLIANPKMALLGGAAQLGVFATLFGVALLNFIPGIDYTMKQASAIAIIGGADGPTSIYVSGKLAPEMMAVIAVAAYSY
ncbi:MAG: sodium ion-translocating decarboxylase subunit beta, partial [Treponema sp.]|nr:sodium ion-translocating decarboxylase subunit beta [Treponema sp.]